MVSAANSAQSLAFQVHHIFPREIFDPDTIAAIEQIFAGQSKAISLDANGNKIALFTDPAAAAQVLQSYANNDPRFSEAGFGGGLHPPGSHPGYNNFIRFHVTAIIADSDSSDAQKRSQLWTLHEFATRISMGTVTYDGQQLTVPGKSEYAPTLNAAFQLFSNGAYNGNNGDNGRLTVFTPGFEQGSYIDHFDSGITDGGSGNNSEARLNAIEGLLEMAHATGDLPPEKYAKYTGTIAEIRAVIDDSGLENHTVWNKIAALGRAIPYDAAKHTDVFTNTVDYNQASLALENAAAESMLAGAGPTTTDPDRVLDSFNTIGQHLNDHADILPPNFSGFGQDITSSLDVSFNHVLANIGGGVIGDTAEFLNMSYDAIKKGVDTGDWGDFHQAIATYGAGALISAAVTFGTVGLAGLVFGPLAAAAVVGAWVAYGVYDGLVNIAELLDKVWTDAEAGYFGPFWQKLANFFTNPVISPLVLDLDGDGLDLVAIGDSAAHFDLDQDGLAEKTAWIGADDALLARDVNGNGRIDNLSELFGGQEQDGFTTLAAHDLNADGAINASDAIFAQLRLWRDLDGDGVTDAGELSTLASAGITAIDLDAAYVDRWAGGNWISHESTYQATGGQGAVFDVWFENDQTNAIDPDADNTAYDDDVALLPNLVGYGNLTSLHSVLAADQTLRADVGALVRRAGSLTYAQMADEVEQLLLRWAGVDTAPTDTRGPNVDAQHLAFLEQVHGVAFVAYGGGANPGLNAGNALESYYDSVVGSMTARFLAQVNVSAHKLWVEDGETGVFSLPVPAFQWFLFDHATDSLLGGFEDAIRQVALGETEPGYDDSDSFEPVTLSIGGIADLMAVIKMLRTDFDGRAGGSLVDAAKGILADLGVSDAVIAIVDGASIGVPVVAGTEGDDALSGTQARDILGGGAGDDQMNGGFGSDSYLYTRGDGHDAIADESFENGSDRLVLQGVDSADVSLVRSGNDLTLEIAASAPGAGDEGSILLKSSLDENFGQGIEQIVLHDGTLWTKADLRLMLIARATTDGDDIITGFNTADMLTGGHGDDQLSGGIGNDTYVFSRGDGNDRILDGGSAGDQDKLIFADVARSQVRVIQHADKLILLVNGGADGRIELIDQLDDAGGIEHVQFANNTALNKAGLLARAVASDGTIVTHLGASYDETIAGSAIADIIEGQGGNDTLSGGAGDDSYVYRRGDGNDAITEDSNAGKADKLILRGIDPSKVTLSASGNDIIVAIAESAAGQGDGGSITLRDGLASPVYAGVEAILFDDGTSWSPTGIDVWLDHGEIDGLTALNLVLDNALDSLATAPEKLTPALEETLGLLMPALVTFVTDDLGPFVTAIMRDGVVPVLTGDFAALGPALADALRNLGPVVDGTGQIVLPAVADSVGILLPVLSDLLLNDVVPALNQRLIVDGLIPALTGDLGHLETLLGDAFAFLVPALTGAVDTLVPPVTEIIVDGVIPVVGGILVDGLAPVLTGDIDDPAAFLGSFIGRLFGNIQSVVAAVGDALVPAVGDVLGGLLPAAAGFVGDILPIVGDILADDVLPILPGGAELSQAIIDDVFDFAVPLLSGTVEGVTAVTTDLILDDILPIVSDILVDGVAPVLTGDVSGLFPTLGNAVGGLVSGVADVLTDDIPSLFGFGPFGMLRSNAQASWHRDDFDIL